MFLVYPPLSAFHSPVICLTIVITVCTEMTTSLYTPSPGIITERRDRNLLRNRLCKQLLSFSAQLSSYHLSHPSFLFFSALQRSKHILWNSCETHPASHSHPPCSSHHNQIHFNTGTNRSQSRIEEGQERSGGLQEEGKEKGNKMSGWWVKVRYLHWGLLNKPSSI